MTRTITIYTVIDDEESTEVIHNNDIADPARKVTGTITKELNAIDSLQFNIYPDNPGYNKLYPCLTNILVNSDSTTEFLGRVLKVVPIMDSNGTIYEQVTCEGYLAYLQDASTEYTAYSGTPASIISTLIMHVAYLQTPNRQINVLDQTGATDSVSYTTSGGTVYDEVMSIANTYSLELGMLDGEFFTEWDGIIASVVISTKVGEICNSSIDIGENLISFSSEKDMSNLCTRVVPLGQKLYTDEDNLEYLTIKDVNNSVKYLENNTETYGVIQRTLLYPDITDATELMEQAQNYLDTYSVPYDTYNITALDPHLLDNTKDAIKIGNYYKINAKILGVDGLMLRVTKHNICIDNPANDSFEIGATSSATSIAAGAITQSTIDLLKDSSITQNLVVTKQLVAQQAWINDLEAVNITTENLKASVAQIDTLTATDAIIKNIIAQAITTDSITAAVGNITNLTSESAIITAIRNVIINSDFSTSVISNINDAIITNAMIASLSASKISAGTIYTDNVQIQSSDGNMVLKDATMQISDGTQVRVQIGKDSDGYYSLTLWDTDGNLIWDADGVTARGIRDGLIINDMVSEDANINASKIDMPSLIAEINNGTETIKASAITYDPDGQNLDISFSKIVSQLLDDLGYNLYYDSQELSEGWAYSGDYSYTNRMQWDDDHRHYDCKLINLQPYAYVDSSWMLTDGVVYTLSAYAIGNVMAYYPTAISTDTAYTCDSWTRISYTFTYDSSKGKPVFTAADTNGCSIYAIKLEYGGAVTEYCLTAEEENRESLIQTANLQVSNTNLSFELYEKDSDNKTKISKLSQTVDKINATVGEFDDNYATKTELALKADSASLSVYQTVDGMSNYATTTWTAEQVATKVSSGDVCSEINQSSDTISLKSNRLIVESTNFTLDNNGNTTFSGSLSGATGTFAGNISAETVDIASNSSMGNQASLRLSDGTISLAATSLLLNSDNTFLYHPEVSGESVFHYGTYSDPVLGISCAVKCSGNLGTDSIYLQSSMIGRYTDPVGNTISVAIINGASNSTLYFGGASGNLYETEVGLTTAVRGESVRLYAHSGGGVYLGSSGSTAITSDETLKDLYEVDSKFEDFFNNLVPVSYKYKDRENKTYHRKHMGFGAQSVEKALTDAGLTTEEFAGVLKDTDVTIAADEAGTEEDVHYDELYSLRYEEFIALNTYMIKKLTKRVEELEQKVADLEDKN